MVDGATVGEMVGIVTGGEGVGCITGGDFGASVVGGSTGILTGDDVAGGWGGVTGELVFMEGGTRSMGGNTMAGARVGDEVEG